MDNINKHDGILYRWLKLERKMRKDTDDIMMIREMTKAKYNPKDQLYFSIQKLNDMKAAMNEFKQLVLDTYKETADKS
jgi:hypothetical protein